MLGRAASEIDALPERGFDAVVARFSLFEMSSGNRIEPETIRRYTLNLLGQRAVDAGGNPGLPG